MKLKLNTVAMAIAITLATGTASAAIDPIGAGSLGNGSVLFVALDANSNTALTVDLGLNIADFISGASRTLAGTSITWNFGTNTVNDAAITGNSWDAAFNTFKNTQAGGDLRWGVVSGDSVNGASVTASNSLVGRGILATGNPTVTEMTNANTSSPTGNALGVLNNYYAAVSNFGNLISANNGAAATDSSSGAGGAGYVGTNMRDNFGGFLTWSYLVGQNETSAFQYQQQVVANPVVFQIGDPFGTDAFSANAGTFAFNVDSGQLSFNVSAIPEAETYAMLLAGLAVIGSIVRRRKS